MKIILLVFVLSTTCHAELFFSRLFNKKSQEKSDPAFLENHYLDKPFSELNSKYRNGFYTDSCPNWVKDVSKKNDQKFTCYTIKLMSGIYRDDILVVVHNKIIKAYLRGFAGNPNIVIPNAPTPEEEFGSEAPTKIYEPIKYTHSGTNNYTLYWELKTGYIRADISCVRKRYAGKAIIDPLRKCAAYRIQQIRLIEYSEQIEKAEKNKDVKISDAKY